MDALRAASQYPDRSVVRALGISAVLLCAAGPPSADADWPCVQRLMPVITAGSLWNGPEATGDWRADPAVAALVEAVAQRTQPVETGIARLKQYAVTVPQADRPARLAQVFAGLLDQTNQQRTQTIERIRAMARRQSALAEATSRITAEQRALPATTPADDRDEVTNRRALMIREYESIGRTLRYSCEVPVQLETQLGRFVQVLQASLPN